MILSFVTADLREYSEYVKSPDTFAQRSRSGHIDADIIPAVTRSITSNKTVGLIGFAT